MPDEAAISAATLGELHFGLHLARDDEVRHAPVARAYGMLAHVVATQGRKPRRRAMDLLVAATAHAHGVTLYTRDAGDFAGLEDYVSLRIV